MDSDMKYMKQREIPEKDKKDSSRETEGMICAIVSGILFGTMPLMAKAVIVMLISVFIFRTKFSRLNLICLLL